MYRVIILLLFLSVLCFVNVGRADCQSLSIKVVNPLRVGRISGVSISSSGRLLVSDGSNGAVRVFTANGQPFGNLNEGSVANRAQLPGTPFVKNDGAIVVPDTLGNLIRSYTPEGNLSAVVGLTLLGGAYLNHPSQVVGDQDGNLFIADTNNHRILKVDTAGNFIWSAGSRGIASNQLRFPSGIGILPNGEIIVSDTLNNRFSIWSQDGTFLRTVEAASTNLSPIRPSVISVASDGSIWSISEATKTVVHFSGTFERIGQLSYTSGNSLVETNPVSVVSIGDLIYVGDSKLNQVIKFDVSGTVVDRLLTQTGDVTRIDSSRSAAINLDGSIWVADTANNRISIYGPDGSYNRTIGSFGEATGQFNRPTSVSISETGLVAIADSGNHRIQVVDATNNVVSVFGSTRDAVPDLNFPNQAVWSTDGSIWVVDTNNSQIKNYTSTGSFIQQVGSFGSTPGLFSSPESIFCASSGNVYVADTYNHRIQIFSPTGMLISAFGRYGNKQGEFIEPSGLFIDSSGYLTVLDRGNRRVQVFDSLGVFVMEFATPADSPLSFDDLGFVDRGMGRTLLITDSGQSSVFEVVLDNSNPSSQFTVNPDVSWSNTDVTATIISTDNSGGFGVKEIHYSINTGAEQIVSSSTATFTITETGAHSISYFAVDNAGNTETTQYATVKIDKIAPVTTLSQNAGFITLSATDAHSGVAKIKYQINGGAVADYSVPFADTVHKVTYWAEDVAGNSEAAKTDIINAGVQSITVSQSRLIGGTGIVGTVTLDKAAGVGGTVINLASSLPGVALVDPTVMVPEGATTASFDIDANPVAIDTSVSITASIYETSQSALLTVLAPTPVQVSWSTSPVVGGTSTTGTLIISGPAPSGGTTVSLASSSLSAIVGSSVTIPTGAMTASFTVSTNTVSNDTSAIVSATVYGVKLKSTLSILGPKVTSVTLASGSIASTTTTTGTITLSTNAPVGGKVVNLSSSNSAVASVPVSVTVAAGTRTATFTITAGTVNANTNVTITATTNGSTGTATITVTPPAAVLSTLTTVVTAVTGGLPVTGTVVLTSPAPTGGVIVTLASSSTTIGTVPASVTVAAGATSATFTITTRTVTAASSLTITATRNGVSKTATITVNPVRVVSTLTLNPTSVRGGTNSTGTVTLTGIATEAVVVTLTSGTTAVARVPTSVTVPAGSTTATFIITTLTQTSTRTSIITARTGTTSRTATLSVTR